MNDEASKSQGNNAEENEANDAALARQISDLKGKIASLEEKVATLENGQGAALKEINEAIALLDVYLQRRR